MKRLLKETCAKVWKRKRKKLTENEYANLQKRYRNILTRGISELPAEAISRCLLPHIKLPANDGLSRIQPLGCHSAGSNWQAHHGRGGSSYHAGKKAMGILSHQYLILCAFDPLFQALEGSLHSTFHTAQIAGIRVQSCH